MIIVILTIIIIGGIGIASFLYLGIFRSQQYNNNYRPFLRYPYNNSLKVEVVAEGLSLPTSMEFIDNKDILVLEKEKGTVRFVSLPYKNSSAEEPALKLTIDPEGERGLLGIAAKKDDNRNNEKRSHSTSVFLYYTHSNPPKNSIYKYHWNGQKLINPELVLDLPSQPRPYHQGGKLLTTINKDDQALLYAVIGDLTSPNTLLQNNKNGKMANNTSIVLGIEITSAIDYYESYDNHSHSKSTVLTSDGNKSLNQNVNGSNNRNFSTLAYGIRNSFGLAVDPLTGNLWDTENGEDGYDEINFVKTGFNSGWMQVMGPIHRNLNKTQDDLVLLNGFRYADPVFSWKIQIGVTDIEFLNTTRLGAELANNILVGDINYGNLYYFKVNSSRTGIELPSELGSNNKGLADHVVDDDRELSLITFGTNFGRITDIETGPDGLLYILSYEGGKIFRISPNNQN
jgi:aldose sugar dehydrogenase